jgi:hypothetical protein
MSAFGGKADIRFDRSNVPPKRASPQQKDANRLSVVIYQDKPQRVTMARMISAIGVAVDHLAFSLPAAAADVAAQFSDGVPPQRD